MIVRLSRIEALGIRNNAFRAGIHSDDHALRAIGVKITKELHKTKDNFVNLDLSLTTLEKIRDFNLVEASLVGA